MVMNIANALAAYKQSSNGAGIAAKVGGASGETQGVQSFGDMLKGYVGDTASALSEGEQLAQNAATGRADIASVVTAISKAEMMLQTVVTIRDKVISAYQDITKTSI